MASARKALWELREAQAMGISFFCGEAEDGRLDGRVVAGQRRLAGEGGAHAVDDRLEVHVTRPGGAAPCGLPEC